MFHYMPESEFVRRLRRRIDADPSLTVAGLAVAAGLNNSAIRSLFSGKSKNPRADTMEKICAALGTTVVEFMTPESTDAEREIVRLVGLLPDHLRRQLLGYAEALVAQQDPAPPKAAEDDR